MEMQATIPTYDELKAALTAERAERAHFQELYNATYRETVRLTDLLNAERELGDKPTRKQAIMHNLVMCSVGGFPHFFSVKGRWARAERLYAEGVKRGHYPQK